MKKKKVKRVVIRYARYTQKCLKNFFYFIFLLKYRTRVEEVENLFTILSFPFITAVTFL